MNKQLFTINEAAKLLGVSIKTLRRWDEKGLLKAQRTIGNQRRYAIEELEKLKGKKIKSTLRKQQSSTQRQLSIAEAAALLGISVKTLRRWEAKDLVKSHRSPTNQRYFLTTEITSLNTAKTEPEVFKPIASETIAKKPTPTRFNPTHPFALPQMKFGQTIFPIIGIIFTVAALGGAMTLTQIAPPVTQLLSYLPQALIGGTETESDSQVLQSATTRRDIAFKISVPVEILSTASVSGNLTAPNILYSVLPGDNITISGDPQNPTISAVVEDIESLGLVAGSGIAFDGTTITNTAPGTDVDVFANIKVGSTTISAGSNTDTLELAAGSNITLSTDTSNKKITISGSGSSGGISGIAVLEGGTSVSDDIATLDFLGGDFDVGESPSGEANISLASTLSSVTGVSGNFSIGGTTTLNGLTYSWPASQGASYILQTNGSGTLSWIDSGSLPNSDKWDSTNGAIYPKNASVLDLLIGGVSTTSAKFAVTGINGSATPFASVSATTASGGNGNGITLGGNSSIQSLQNSTLTLGGDTTGNIILSPRNGSGDTRFNGTTTLNGLTYSWPSSQTNGYILQTNGSGTLTWTDPGTLPTSDDWDSLSGVLYPKIITQDVIIGGTATSSARFHAYGSINSGTTPSASLAAQSSFASLVVDNSGSGDLFTASASGQNRFVIKQNGNIGIGTAEPARNLEIATPVNSAFMKYNGTGIDDWTIGAESLGFVFYDDTDGGAVYRLVLGENENVGIGTTAAPDVGTFARGIEIYDTSAALALTATSGKKFIIGSADSPTGLYFRDETTGAYRMVIDTNGRIGVNTGISSVLGTLDVRGNSGTIPVASISGETSFASLIVDNSGSGDLFTASKSGAPKFTILNNGNISWAGTGNFQTTLASAPTAAQTITVPDTAGAGGAICISTLGNCAGVGGVGDVIGPGSSTDNAIVRFNGATGKSIQNSGITIDDSNNVTGVNSLSILPATNITGLTLTGTNVTSSKLAYLNANNTSGTIFDISYGSTQTLTGSLIGQAIDLNNGQVTATNQDVTGQKITLPTITNTNAAGTQDLLGLQVTFGSGSGINQNGAGATIYSALDVLLPALTQTQGSLTANGLAITTPSSITTGGVANGLLISPTGVGAGTLHGINVATISAASTGNETALHVGSGWDTVLRVNGTPVINGQGVTLATGGGTGQSSYTTGDMLYASATNTLSKLAIGGSDGYVLQVSSGVPAWGTITGSSCTTCVITNPSSSATNTITPTGQATTGLIVKQTSTASPTNDIFQVTDSSGGTIYFRVDKDGNVYPSSTIGNTLTLTPTTDTTALTLVGTNVTTANLQYINAKNQQGTILNLAYGATQTLSTSTPLIGIGVDLSTNVTATNANVTGQSLTLPTTTNTHTSGTKTLTGVSVSAGGGINQNGAGGTTTFAAFSGTIPALTQTAGTLNGYGVNITTPSSITTGGTAAALNVAASGVGAGTLYGLNISGVTAGAGTETALAIGSGWDTVLSLNGTTIIDGSGNLNVANATGILPVVNGGSPFEQNQGAIFPRIITQDLIIGGVATTSARFHAYGSINAGTTPAASISANATFAGFVVDNSLGDLFTASSSGLNRFVITQNGNVGIGTTLPSGSLHIVQPTTQNALRIDAANSNLINTLLVNDHSGNAAIAYSSTYRTTSFYGGLGSLNTPAVGIQSNSATGIGISLRVGHLSGNSLYSTAATASISAKTSFATLVVDNDGAGDIFTASSSGLNRFVINQNGNVGIGTTNPLASLHIDADGPTGNLTNAGIEVNAQSWQPIISTNSAEARLLLNNQDSSQVSVIGNYGSSGFLVGQQNGTSGAFAGITQIGYNNLFGSFYDNWANSAGTLPTSGSYINARSNEYMDFMVGGTTPQMRFDGFGLSINANGSVGYANSNLEVLGRTTAGINQGFVASISGKTGKTTLLVDNLSSVGDLFTASAAGLTRFVIEHSGNVGIGTALPSEILHIRNPDTTGSTFDTVFYGDDTTGNQNAIRLRVKDTASGTSFADIGADYSNSGISGNTNLTFSTRKGAAALAEAMRITNNLNVGIGTTTPLGTFNVQPSNINGGTLAVASVSGRSSFAALTADNSLGDLFTASSSGLERFTIKQNGQIQLDRTEYATCANLQTVSGLLTCGSGGNSAVYGINNVAGSGTTTSSSYADMAATSSLSFTKASGTSKLLITVSTGAYSTVTATEVQIGVRIDSTDYDCGFFFFNTASQHDAFTCSVVISGSSAGSKTVQMRWKRPSGTGTITQNNDDWNSLTVTEVETGDSLALWDAANGAIFERNVTQDLLIGGVSTASANFHVWGSAASGTNPAASVSANTTGTAFMVDNRGTGNLFNVLTNGGSRFMINNAGNIGVGTTSPDGHFNIVDTLDAATAGADNLSLFLRRNVASNTTGPGIGFASTTTTDIVGAKIVHIRTGSNSQGDLAFYVKGDVGTGDSTTQALRLSAVGTSPIATFSGHTSFAGMVVDNTGAGDIFTASSSGLNRFVIKQNGNVGIGTTLPSASLHIVQSTTQNALRIDAANSGLVNTLAVYDHDGNTAIAYSSSFKTTTFYGGSGGFNTPAVGIQSTSSTGIGMSLRVGHLSGSSLYSTAATASISAKTSFATLVVDNDGAGDIITASSSGLNRFVIKQNGNVGIGTTLPTSKLHVFTDTAAESLGLFRDNSIGGSIEIFTILTDTPVIRSGTNDSLNFAVNNTNTINFTINNAGLIGANTTTPLSSFDHRPNPASGGTISVASVSGRTSFAALVADNSLGDIFTASSSGLNRFVIKQNGNVGIGTTIPTGILEVSNSTVGNEQHIGLLLDNDDITDPFSLGMDTSDAGRRFIVSAQGGTLRQALAFGDVSSSTGTVFGISTSSDTGNTWNPRFIIEQSGNIGVGTTSPLATLDIRGNSGTTPIASLSAKTSFAGLVVDNTGAGDLFTASSSGLMRFVIQNNGNVGIGTTLPTEKLSVTANSTNYAGSLYQQNTDGWGQYIWINNTDTDKDALHVDNSIGSVFFVRNDGRIAINATTPLATLDVRPNLVNGGTISVASVSGRTSFTGLTVDNSLGDLFTASSSGLNRFVIKQNGNVGIGTNNPGARLEITGDNSTENVATFWAGANMDSTITIGSTNAPGQEQYITYRNTTTGSNAWMAGMDDDEEFRFDYGAAGEITNNFLTIEQSGEVGINTGDPEARLDITAPDSPADAMVIFNPARTQGLYTYWDGSNIVMGASNQNVTIDDTLYVINDIMFTPATAGTTNNALCWDNSGDTAIYDCDGTPADYAESYPVATDVTYGDIVMTTSEMVTTTIGTRVPRLVKAVAGSGQVLGITSDNYHDFTSAGKEEIRPEDNPMPVALNGRVPVKVSSANGTIAIGDPLTVSSIPGVAVKATTKGSIIGRALEAYTNTDPAVIGTTMTFVQNSWYDPDIYLTDSGNISIFEKENAPELESASTYGVQMPDGSEVIRTGVFSDAVIGNLKSGSLDVQSLSLGGQNLNDRLLGLEGGFASASAGFASPLAALQTQVVNLQDRVASLEASLAFLNSASGSALFINNPLAGFTASTGAELSLDKIDVTDALISNNLNVLGYTTMNELSVTGSIRTGVLTIKGQSNGGASISTLNGDLRLQDEGFGGIDILDGSVTIDTSGNIQTQGDITAKKFNVDTSSVSGASAGSVTIEAGDTFIDVDTTALTTDSLIFVTPNKPVMIGAEKKDTNTFTIKLQQAQTTDLKVNWWLIN